MHLTRRAPPYAQVAIVSAWFLGPMTAAAPQPVQPRLDFEVQEGLNINRFVREGNVAAHLLLRSGTDPRVLIAFPAGNSGVGLWFVHSARLCSPVFACYVIISCSGPSRPPLQRPRPGTGAR